MKLTVFASAFFIAIVFGARADSVAQSVVATRPVQGAVAEPVLRLSPIGYCTSARGPVDLSRLWYLENRSVEVANHRVGLRRQSVGITILDATPVTTHHYELPWMVSEGGPAGDPDIELKLVVLDGQLAVYWRETYQHRMYRQGLFRVKGAHLVRWCEGRGVSTQATNVGFVPRSPALRTELQSLTRSAIVAHMSKSDRSRYDHPLGAKAYASMAEVEGLRLSEESSKRLKRTKGLPQAKRRAEVLRAYTADKPRKK